MEGSPPRVGKAPPATIGHNSEVMTVEEKVANLYHSKKDRIFVRGFQGEYNVKKELDRLDRQITRAGEREAKLHADLAANAADYEKLTALGAQLAEVEAERADLEERWLEVAGSLE